MTDRFHDQLLDDFAHTFYGYGSFGGRFWFIGMEEHSSGSFAEIDGRLKTWANRGRRELEDVAGYHIEMGITHPFEVKPKLQPTWNKLIRIVLSSQGQTPTTDQVREYQMASLGRLGGDTCLLELLPLPSPSTGSWLYGQYSRLRYLADRETYIQACLAPRITHLRKRIDEHKPETVVFYSLSYREHWRAIAGVDLLQESDGVYFGRNRSTLYVMTKNPAAKGVTSDYFHQIGSLIRAKTGEL